MIHEAFNPRTMPVRAAGPMSREALTAKFERQGFAKCRLGDACTSWGMDGGWHYAKHLPERYVEKQCCSQRCVDEYVATLEDTLGMIAKYGLPGETARPATAMEIELAYTQAVRAARRVTSG